jgi:hypothetical protein
VFNSVWILRAHAAEIRGQVRTGAYTRQVTFKESFFGETSNDEHVVSGQLRLDLLKLNDNEDRVLFNGSDKFDNFGKLNRNNLNLTSYNRFQLRTAAYQRPWEKNPVYFTVGRFALPEANIFANDGMEAGYRLGNSTRLGIFGGQGPKDVLTPLYVDPTIQDSIKSTQLGAYVSYENKENFDDSSYFTQAIGQAPTYNITDTQSHTYYYQRGMWLFTPVHRLLTLVHYDFSPRSTLRRGYASYTYLTDDIRATGYIQQTNTEDYLINQTLQESLKPSPVQNVNLEARHRLSPTFSIDYKLSFGKRTIDSKKQNEYAFGFLFPGLLSESGSGRTQLGIRDNFQSREKFFRVGYDYWSDTFSIQFSHLINKEDYEDGTANLRQVSFVDGASYLSDNLRASLGYQHEEDSKVSANAFFLMIGYRFGSGSVSSGRLKPAKFESI